MQFNIRAFTSAVAIPPVTAPVISANAFSPTRIDVSMLSTSTGGTGGYTYELDGSPDNVNWTNITTTAVFTYQNTGLSALQLKYYRARGRDTVGTFSAYSASVNATTPAVDTTPDVFTFTDQTGVALSTVITSASITVNNINSPATITVSGGTYDINGSGSFTSSSGTVSNGDTVRARVTSSGSNSTGVSATVTIGGVSDTFTATTSSSGATLIIYDNFEDVTIGGGISGRGNADFQWDPANPATLSVTGANDRAVSGSRSIKFAYAAIPDTGGDDGQNLEQRFTCTNRYSEWYIGFNLWVPVGFQNVTQSGGTSNKKFLALWCEDVYAGWGACIFEHEPDGSGNSTLTPTYRDEFNASSHGFADSVIFIDKTADVGKWMKVGIHLRQQTTSATTGSGSSYRGSGVCEVWKNNVLFRSITNFPNWNPDGHGLKYGYLLGAANGGYRVATQFNIDDFTLGTSAADIAAFLP